MAQNTQRRVGVTERGLAVGVLAIGAAAALAACGGADPAPSPEPTPTSAGPTPPPPTPTPTPTLPADCNALLSESALDDLLGQGFEPFPPSADPWDPPIAQEFLDDGLLCGWGRPDSGDIVEYGAMLMSEDDWATRREQLLADGWVELDEPEGFLDAPDLDTAGNVNNQGVIWQDGILYYVLFPGAVNGLDAFGNDVILI